MDQLVIAHIAVQLQDHRARPLFVAIQGPQGSGKSYLSAQLKSQLSEPPYSLNVAVISIDDLYLRHHELAALAAQGPLNPLWAGRGQPGTHDVDLGITILRALRSQEKSVELPVFDKSLFDGKGDRLSHGSTIYPPIDVVIFEGWCVGFCPISHEELDKRWDGIWREECRKLSLSKLCEKSDLGRINEVLKRYTEMWSYIDVFIQIKPVSFERHDSDYSIIYRWRLEQEQYMKASSGGRGMSDDAVKAFVDRYIPGYVFFGDFCPGPSHQPHWIGKSLRLFVAEDRRLVDTEIF